MSSDQLLLSKPACVRRDGGFTMVEILVTMIIVSIFATILFQLVRGQGNFVAIQGGRSEAQQNARGALEIIAADLRAASPQSLVDGRDNALTLNVPRVWGVVCGTPSTTAITAVFPAVPANMATTIHANTGITVDEDGAPDVSRFVAGGAITSVAAVDLAVSGCTAEGDVQVYRFTGSGFPEAVRNEPMFLHDRITYDVETGTDNMLWIRRTHGNTPQPLAGPLPAATDLRFSYLAGGPTPMNAPGIDQTALRSVGRIRVDVQARSRHKVNGQHQMERDSITVSLRN